MSSKRSFAEKKFTAEQMQTQESRGRHSNRRATAFLIENDSRP
jgi:hypothetical protein